MAGLYIVQCYSFKKPVLSHNGIVESLAMEALEIGHFYELKISIEVLCILKQRWGGQQTVEGREKEWSPLLRKIKTRQGRRPVMKPSRRREQGVSVWGPDSGKHILTSARGDDDEWPILQAGFQNYNGVICIIKKNYSNLQLLRSRQNWSEKNSINKILGVWLATLVSQ